LLCAASNGHLEIVQWLLQNGAALAEKNENGDTALLCAALNGHLEIVQWLLQNGVALAEKDEDGDTALLCAALNGHLEMVQWLLQNGATLSEKNENGDTALLCAACYGHLEIVQWILKHGATTEEGVNLSDKNKAGKTVFDVAKKGETKSFLMGFKDGYNFRISGVHGRLFKPANTSSRTQAIFIENAAHQDEKNDTPLAVVVGQKRKRISNEPIHLMSDTGDNLQSTRIPRSRIV
jgi:serine/threonine-protein phosphatase 6 regulatory ankyrin repeat subunit B